MFTDPLFDRHKASVWPLFWPVLVLAILLFRQRADDLMARGCYYVGYEVAPWGQIWITETLFRGARASWKDQLFEAVGAYGSAGASPPLCGVAFDRLLGAALDPAFRSPIDLALGFPPSPAPALDPSSLHASEPDACPLVDRHDLDPCTLRDLVPASQNCVFVTPALRVTAPGFAGDARAALPLPDP